MILRDLVQVRVTSLGTSGPLQLGVGIDGGRDFAAAGYTTGQEFPYSIRDGALIETGRGIYDAATNRCTRVFGASTTGLPINLSGNAVLRVAPLAADFSSLGGSVRINAPNAATWILPNPLGRKCAVQVFVMPDEPVIADFAVSDTFITVTFPVPVSGYVMAS